MRSFREGQVGISKYLSTNSTLPFLVDKNSNSDVKNKFHDNRKKSPPQVKRYQLTFWQKNEAGRAKRNEFEQRSMSKLTAFSGISGFSTAWTKITDSLSHIPTEVENFRLRPWGENSSQYFCKDTTLKIQFKKTSGLQCRNGIKISLKPILLKK